MIDTTDQGWVYNPKTQPEDVVGDLEDAIAGVRAIQLAGRYIIGGSDSRLFERSENNSQQVDSYFLLDNQIGKHTNFPSYEALRGRAQDLGIGLNLKPIDTIYSRYKFTWFEVFVGLTFLQARWVIRLRRTRDMSLHPARSAKLSRAS